MEQAQRRNFLLSTSALLAAAVASFAQTPQAKIPRIGFLGVATPAAWAPRIDAFRAGLRDLGYVEDKNIVIEFRFAEGQYDRLPALAAELVRLKVDVIVTHSVPGALAAKEATATIPIPVVMTNVGDAVERGIVASLARPGGNITGDTFFAPELAAKRLEVLKEAIPRIRRVAVLVNPDNPGPARLQAMEKTAKALEVTLVRFDARGPDELNGIFAAMVKERVDSLAVVEDPALIPANKQIAELAVKHHRDAASALMKRDDIHSFKLFQHLIRRWRLVFAEAEDISACRRPVVLGAEYQPRLITSDNLQPVGEAVVLGSL